MNSILFTRVSTPQQTHDEQVDTLTKISQDKGWSIDTVYREVGSGLISGNLRETLTTMLKYIPTTTVSVVAVSNISKLSCRPNDVEKLMTWLHSKGISIYVANLDILSIGNEDIIREQALLAEQQINQMKSNYVESNKLPIGRKEGYRKPKISMMLDHKDVADLLKQGYSIRKVGEMTGKSTTTVQKVKRLL
jgi:DNA invertase Pin-like site-specific DNA recombinase